MRIWSGPEAAKLVDCSYSRLDSWARQEKREPGLRRAALPAFIEPTTAANGTGTRRQYTFQDLVVLRLAVRLRKDGVRVPIAPMRRLLAHVRNRGGLGTPEAKASGIFLVTDGVKVWEMAEADTFRARSSAILLYVVDLGSIVDEMSAKVRPKVQLKVLRMPRGVKPKTKNTGPLLRKGVRYSPA